MKRITKLAVGLALLLLLGAGAVLWLAWKPAPEALPELVGPNAYTNFLYAGRLMTKALPNDAVDKNSLADLKAYVESQKETLTQVRSSLGQPCQVAVEYSQPYLLQHGANIAAFKRLAQLLIAEGLVAEQQAQISAAVKSYWDALRLSRAASHGGDYLDALVGLSMEKMACQRLENLVDKMPPAEAQAAHKSLTEFISQADPVEVFIQQEEAFVRQVYDLSTRMAWAVSFRHRQALEQNMRQKVAAAEMERQRLQTRLAARANDSQGASSR